MNDAEFKQRIDEIMIRYEVKWKAIILVAQEKINEAFRIFEQDVRGALSRFSSSGEATRPTAESSPTVMPDAEEGDF